MAKAAGLAHPRRAAQSCPNGHPYTEDNTRQTTERRWSKTKQVWTIYVSRQCRRCQRVRKKFEARRLRRSGHAAGSMANAGVMKTILLPFVLLVGCAQ